MEATGLEHKQKQNSQSRVPKWVATAIFGFFSSMLRSLSDFNLVSSLLWASLIFPLVEIAEPGPIRKRLRSASVAWLTITSLILTTLKLPRLLSSFMPGYLAQGVSIFALLLFVYCLMKFDGNEPTKLRTWVIISASTSALWGAGWWLIPIIHQRWQW
jgi:hypothetical protein